MIQTLLWFPEGTLYNGLHKALGKEGNVQQSIADETPEEVLEETKLLFALHSRAAVSAQPIVRVLLVGSDKTQIKPLSAILRWLRGDQRAVLAEYNASEKSLPLYLDFVPEAACGGKSM